MPALEDRFRPPEIPASFFGIVLGLAGLGNAWRAAHQVWGLPAMVGEVLLAIAAAVWAALLVLYILRLVFARAGVVEELFHPVQCCFVGLIGVATMLVALGALPYSRTVALAVFSIGATGTLAFAVWRTGLLWHGERDPATTTPVLYLPTVAGMFVAATAAGALGFPDWGQLAFGAGFFSWVAIESVLLHRLYTAPAMPAGLRPTLGIQLAPPTVGAVAYIAVTSGPPDWLAHAMIGYGVVQALVLLRLLPWIREQGFAASYWAFTFGATALATAPLRLMARGDTGAIPMIAPFLFAGANLVVGVTAAGTLFLAFQGRLLPRPAPSPR